MSRRANPRSMGRRVDRRGFLRVALAAAVPALLRPSVAIAAPTLDPRETRLANLRQLTAGGQNAEAYWDFAGSRLIFQSTRPPYDCDQMFTMRATAASSGGCLWAPAARRAASSSPTAGA